MCKVLVVYFKDVSSPAAVQSVQDAAVSTHAYKMLLYLHMRTGCCCIYTNETGGHGHLLFAMCCIDTVLMNSGKIRESGMKK